MARLGGRGVARRDVAWRGVACRGSTRYVHNYSVTNHRAGTTGRAHTPTMRGTRRAISKDLGANRGASRVGITHREETHHHVLPIVFLPWQCGNALVRSRDTRNAGSDLMLRPLAPTPEMAWQTVRLTTCLITSPHAPYTAQCSPSALNHHSSVGADCPVPSGWQHCAASLLPAASTAGRERAGKGCIFKSRHGSPAQHCALAEIN